MSKPTLAIIRDRAYDPEKLVSPRELTEGRFRDLRRPPSLQALKLHAALFKKAGAAVVEDRWFSITLSELRAIGGLRHHDRESLADMAAELRGVVIEWDDTRENGRRFTTFAGLIDIAEVDFDDDGDGLVTMRWKFGEGLRRMVERSQYWAAIDRQIAFQMGSRYSLRLFEMMSLRVNLDLRKSETFSIEELRARLGVPEGKLSSWNNFNQFALKPALADINRLARFTLAARPRKEGRSFVAVEFSWSLKPFPEEPDPPPVKIEHAASTVAPISEQTRSRPRFPASGFVYEVDEPHWRALAERHARRLPGGHLPDLSRLADEFRGWCAAKFIPLDGSGTEKAFIGFCKSYRPPS